PGSSTGSGAVFVSNPVQSLGDESLTDQKDADAAVPAAAYHDVTLTHLDGSGHLSGDYATVVGTTGTLAFSPTNAFPSPPPRAPKAGSSRSWPTTGAPRRRSTPTASASANPGGRSTTGRRRCGSTSSGWTTPSPPTTPRTSCASARAASMMPRTPR